MQVDKKTTTIVIRLENGRRLEIAVARRRKRRNQSNDQVKDLQRRKHMYTTTTQYITKETNSDNSYGH